jgi:cytidine deaminase
MNELYLGVCIDISSGIGFCAEHSAIAAMWSKER